MTDFFKYCRASEFFAYSFKTSGSQLLQLYEKKHKAYKNKPFLRFESYHIDGFNLWWGSHAVSITLNGRSVSLSDEWIIFVFKTIFWVETSYEKKEIA